jgi:2-amino-4-hydroxy-6-hydroxymethyldihydropteridine diphosphokinase
MSSSATTLKKAYIGIGSNLGDRIRHCRRAVEELNRIPGCRVEEKSELYRTEPVGVEDQGWYVNGVVSLAVTLSAQELLEALLSIESDMGRERKKKWDSRIIDLDLLLYGQDVIHMEKLTVPHPLMHLRRFVLLPMAQLAPDLSHPLLGKTMEELLKRIPEAGQAVVPLGAA